MSEIKTERRVAIITGASRGIGRAVAAALAGKGMQVVINYSSNRAAAEETAALCREAAEKAAAGIATEGESKAAQEPLLIQADVSDPEAVNAMFSQVMETCGRVDVLVNNAGITRDGLILRMKDEDYLQVINTNLNSAFFCAKTAAKIMLKQRYGRIINMSSIVGLRGNVGQANYSASKAGIIGLTKSLAKELAARNITVNAVAPGFIATDMTAAMTDQAKEMTLKSIPTGQMGSPEDIANAVCFFAAEESRYITGQVLAVDGGMAV